VKKICFVTTVPSTIEAFILDTAKYLYNMSDYDITIICDEDIEFGKCLPDYIKYIPISMKRGINITGFNAIFKMIKIFNKEQFTIVQYSTPNASFYASIASKLVGVPVRLYCQWGIAYVGFSGFKRRVFKTIEKVVCSLSTWIEPDSYGNLKFSHKEGLYTSGKSSVVWNGSASGVNFKKFDITYKDQWSQEKRSKYSIAQNTYVIGFVGRLNRDKGINELIAATKKFFDDHPNSVLLLVGGQDKFETVDQELYEWSLNDKRIIYCGTTNEVEKYLATMDVFILPSYREGFGSAVIEAQAMGVPVIVTDIPGPTDAMIDGKTGLVVRLADIDSLKTAMVTLHEDKELAEQMSKEGCLFVSSKFDSEKLKQYILEDRNRLLRGT
jgi:glycosyltransferase involved in cell wall biosynthesis